MTKAFLVTRAASQILSNNSGSSVERRQAIRSAIIAARLLPPHHRWLSIDVAIPRISRILTAIYEWDISQYTERLNKSNCRMGEVARPSVKYF